MTEERYNQNQTQFSAEEPLLSQPQSVPTEPVSPPPNTTAEPVAAVVPKKLPRWVWLAGGAAVALLLMVTALMLRSSEEGNVLVPQDQTPQAIRPLSPMELRLEATKALLKEADPTTQGLPFPPVDMLLRIDKTR